MWQDSGRYEWPLTGPYPLSTASAPLVQVIPVPTPDQVVTTAAPIDTWRTVDGTALITNPYAGSPISSAGIVLDTRTYPEQAAAVIADLRRQVEEMKAENCDLLLGHAELTRRLNELRARVAQLEQAKPNGGTL